MTARVESSCRATGTPVRLAAAPDGVSDVEPPGAVVSIVTPNAAASVRAAFGDQVHFFASVVPAAEAHRLAQPLVQALLDDDPGRLAADRGAGRVRAGRRCPARPAGAC